MSRDKINLKGRPVDLLEEVPAVGENAFDFTFVKTDMSESSLYDIDAKVKVLIAVPSLDTGICQMETRKFNEKLAEFKDVIGLVISKDLPFAMKRFCETEGISNVISASDYRYGDFGREFGTEMISGPFKGLSARAVFVVDKDNKIRYSELVPDITFEPEYEKVLAAVKSLL